ncbi:MAG: FHA domain-containing protein [Actinomycetota bacterium]|nr:FHA domain-containing protein [Actinomycetota bacterium]
MITPFVLSVLKYAFLLLLYFFIYRALRTVVTLDLGGGRKARKTRKSAQPKGRAPRPANGRSKVPATVVVRTSDGKKLGSYRLGEPLRIGRSDDADIRLDDTYVSQSHARLFGRNGSWFVEDLGSTNGTYLNQQRVTSPSELHPGDTLKIGKSVLEVRK